MGSPGAGKPHAGKYRELTLSRQRGGSGPTASPLPTRLPPGSWAGGFPPFIRPFKSQPCTLGGFAVAAAFGRAPHDGFEPQAAKETKGARRKAKGFMKTRVLNRARRERRAEEMLTERNLHRSKRRQRRRIPPSFPSLLFKRNPCHLPIRNRDGKSLARLRDPFTGQESPAQQTRNQRNLTADFTDFTDKNSSFCILHSALAPSSFAETSTFARPSTFTGLTVDRTADRRLRWTGNTPFSFRHKYLTCNLLHLVQAKTIV